jgi:hypothetical protein
VALGRIDVAEVILYCPSEADSMRVADLLASQHGWGQKRCRKLLVQLPISEQKTVGSMTDRQRRALAGMLTSNARGRSWSAPSQATDGLRSHVARPHVSACEKGGLGTLTSRAVARV